MHEVTKDIEKALMVTVKYERVELVKQLLKHPSVNLAQLRATLGSDDLAELGTVDEFNELDDDNDRSQLLNLACSNRDLETIELLLGADADVDSFSLHFLVPDNTREHNPE